MSTCPAFWIDACVGFRAFWTLGSNVNKMKRSFVGSKSRALHLFRLFATPTQGQTIDQDKELNTLRLTQRRHLQIISSDSGPTQTQTSQKLPSKLKAKKSTAAKPHGSEKDDGGDHSVLPELGVVNSGSNDTSNEKADVGCT